MEYLSSLISPWVRELGSRDALATWLKVEDFREEVKEAIHRHKYYARMFRNSKWANGLIVLKCKNSSLVDRSIVEIANERGITPMDAYFDVIIGDPDARGTMSRGIVTSWNDSRNLLYTHQSGMVGLDVWTFDDQFKSSIQGIPGSMHYAGFPMVFTTLVRDKQVLTVEEAAQKTSTMAARVYSLKDRGVLKEGSYADIVLMDLQNLKVLGDRFEPRKYPEGIEYVFVNGVPVVNKGEHTNKRPGKVLRKSN